MKNWILITLAVTGLLCGNGCSTPQRAAFTTLQFIADTVAVAKHAYEDYRSVKYDKALDDKLKAAYIHYQELMATAEKMEGSFRKGDISTPVYRKAIDAVAESASEIIEAIRGFLPKENAKKLKGVK